MALHEFRFPLRSSALLLLLVVQDRASGQYIPPDLFGENGDYGYAVIPNMGQVTHTDGTAAPEVKSYTEGHEPNMFMCDESRMNLVWKSVDTLSSTVDTLWNLGIWPIGETANPNVVPMVWDAKDHHMNFYLPHCGTSITNVQGHSRVIYENIFPMIDQHIYAGPRGWKMAFVIHPGGDPEKLRLKFAGYDELSIDVNGFLKVALSGNWIKIPFALAYQVDPDSTITPLNWMGDFSLNASTGTVGFVADTYDPAKPLVLQIGIPQLGGPSTTEGLCWSTYFGGMNGDTDITVIENDKDGNLYAAGTAEALFQDFPGFEFGAVYTDYTQRPIFLSKFLPDHALRWTNYYGSNTTFQWPRGLAVDQANKLYMVGTCGFTPGLANFALGEQFPFSPYAVGFVSAFNTVNGDLLCSSGFLNSSRASVDPEDNKLVVSGNGSNGFIYEPAVQPPGATVLPPGGEQDVFVAKFNLDGTLFWSTFLGGSEWENFSSMAARGGSIAVGFTTESADIPLVTPSTSAYAQDFGQADLQVYLTRFTSGGTQVWGSYFGGDGRTALPLGALDLDNNGDLAIAGSTQSTDLPIVPGGWTMPTLSEPTCQSSFVARFSAADNSLTYCTYLHTTNETPFEPIEVNTVVFGPNGGVFICGAADSDDFPWQEAGDLYFEPSLIGQRDGFVLWLDAAGNMRWSTLFGGQEAQVVDAMIELSYDPIQNLLYGAGSTTANVAAGEFFPLQDPGLPAYFRGIGIEPDDAYITAFCLDDIEVGLDRPEPGRTGIQSWYGDGMLHLRGSPAGAQTTQILDATGRLVGVVTLNVPSDGGYAQALLPRLSPGAYCWQNANATGRFVIPERP